MNNHLLLECDESEAFPIHIGLLSLVKKVPDYEFFYQVNQLNSFQFSRIDDLKLHGTYYDYFFAVFYAYSTLHKVGFHILSNQSIFSVQKKTITEFFVDEQDVKCLLNNHQEIEYIIKRTDSYADFSVILFPEDNTFAVRELCVNKDEELHDILYYYE